MGICASSDQTQKATARRGSEKETVQVIKSDGKLQEFKKPVKASTVTSQYSDCFLCSSESMSIGKCPGEVCGDEELKGGQIYFLLPVSDAKKHISLPELCGLAVRAHAAIGNGSVELSSSFDSKLFSQ